VITDATPPFPIPQIMPASGTEGALLLAWIISVVLVTAAGLALGRWARSPDRDTADPSTDTPETDDAVARWAVRRDATTIIECSRRLERKLVQAEAKRDECSRRLERKLVQAEAKRDEWRGECEQLSTTLAEAFSERDNLNAEIARLRRAREE
jgi:hypothetical protein